MKLTGSRLVLAGLVAAALSSAPMIASAEGEAVIKGTILKHEKDTLLVRTDAGDVTVNLAPDTKVRGVLPGAGLRKETRQQSDLMRGLPIEVKTAGAVTPGQPIAASEVSFRTSALKTAKQIDAGLHSTDENVAANAKGIAENKERIENIGEFQVLDKHKVFFDSGKTAVSSDATAGLCEFADKAKATKGYRLVVVGRADKTGNAAANQKLSLQRAANVRSALVRSCGVEPPRFVQGAALGDASVAQDPDPPKTEAEARRVTVNLVISKANAPVATK